MKKFTLTIAALFAAFTMNAQTTLWEDDFEGTDAGQGYGLIDADGDSNNWQLSNLALDEDGTQTTTALTSYSYDNDAGAALTPDNIIVTPVIDLSAEDGSNNVTLTWDVAAVDPNWADEYYSVYVVVNDENLTVADITNSSVSYSETVTDNGVGGTENFYTKSLDITSFAGEEILVAFRHHNVTDQFAIAIDNISVVSNGTMSVADKSFDNFNYFVDANNTLNLKADTSFSSVKLFSILGQQVVDEKLSSNEVQLDLNGLTSGIYLAQVQIEGNIKTFKFIKK